MYSSRLKDIKAIGPKKFYGSNEVCKIIGITYKQLDYYDRTDFVKPSISGAAGVKAAGAPEPQRAFHLRLVFPHTGLIFP